MKKQTYRDEIYGMKKQIDELYKEFNHLFTREEIEMILYWHWQAIYKSLAVDFESIEFSGVGTFIIKEKDAIAAREKRFKKRSDNVKKIWVKAKQKAAVRKFNRGDVRFKHRKKIQKQIDAEKTRKWKEKRAKKKNQ